MTPSGIEPATFRFVAQHPNHCATAVPSYIYYIHIYVCVCVCVKFNGEIRKVCNCGSGSYKFKIKFLSLNPYSYVCLQTIAASTVITNLLFCLWMLKVISRLADD